MDVELVILQGLVLNRPLLDRTLRRDDGRRQFGIEERRRRAVNRYKELRSRIVFREIERCAREPYRRRAWPVPQSAPAHSPPTLRRHLGLPLPRLDGIAGARLRRRLNRRQRPLRIVVAIGPGIDSQGYEGRALDRTALAALTINSARPAGRNQDVGGVHDRLPCPVPSWEPVGNPVQRDYLKILRHAVE